MFLIFKPPQSYLQVQLLDPDGFKKHSSALEEAYAIKILKERQTKQQEKRKQLSFKKKIKKQLEAGKTTVEIAAELSAQIIAEEPKFEFTEEVRADVARVMAEYQRQVQLETQAMVIEFINQLQQAKDVFQQKRKQKIKAKKIKVLFFLSIMDD
jgi:hypothetical protein